MSRSGIPTGRPDRSIAHFEARKRILAAGYGPLAAHGGLRITAVTLTVSILSAHQVGRIDFDALGRGVAHTRSGASDTPLKRGIGAGGAPKDFLNVAERSVPVRAELALWGAKCGKTAILTHVRIETMSSISILPISFQLGEESALGASVCALQPPKRSVISAGRSPDVCKNPEK